LSKEIFLVPGITTRIIPGPWDYYWDYSWALEFILKILLVTGVITRITPGPWNYY